MNPMQHSLLFILILILAGGLAHLLNMKRIYMRIVSLEGRMVTKDSLYRSLFVPQGSNFNALIMTAWMLIAVSISYLYFFTPAVFQSYNYFAVAPWAARSGSGFVLFGLISAAIVALIIVVTDKSPEGCRCYRAAEIYGFYSLDRKAKRSMVLTIPVLWASIWVSTYLATIYPEERDWGMPLAFILLLVPLAILLSPMFKKLLEGA